LSNVAECSSARVCSINALMLDALNQRRFPWFADPSTLCDTIQYDTMQYTIFLCTQKLMYSTTDPYWGSVPGPHWGTFVP